MASTTAEPLRIAVLISGGGTTLRNLIQTIESGDLNARIGLVLSSRATAGGLRFARRASLESRVVDPAQFDSTENFSNEIFDACRRADVRLVAMGGFLKHVLVPPDFTNRVMNIHPALIPAFCGKGYYGVRVHRAVLDYGAKLTGCTVHFVDNEYDHGPIILQQTVPVLPDDTLNSLAARVFETECRIYPEAVQLFADGRLRIDGRQVIISEGSLNNS